MNYFTMKELVSSPTAESMGIDNIPPKDAENSLTKLAENVLAPLREAFGMPIYVNSGYRCAALNAAVGGVKGSQHIRGEAADITTGSKDGNVRLWRLLRKLKLPVDQAINEHDYSWIHVSYSDRHRRQYLERM